NAIDRFGNNLLRDEAHLKVINQLDNFEIKIDYSNELNLYDSDFLYLGPELKGSNQFTDLTDDTEEIKEAIVGSLTQNKTYYSHSLPDDAVKEETIIQHH